MKILVCVKQVPDMETKFKINSSGDWIAEEDVAFRMNEYDEFAVEEAVALRERLGAGAELTVVSVGPERAKEVVRKALAMGADKGVHIHDDMAPRKDPSQIAGMIAGFASDKGYELVFTGLQSQDRGSAQVGPMIALRLGFALATTAVGVSFEAGAVTVRRELEGGARAVVRVKTPAVVTCQLGLNKPRYPTLPNIMKAKKKELLTIPASGLAVAEPMVKTEKAAYPERRGGAMILTGDINQVAEKFISVIREKTGLI